MLKIFRITSVMGKRNRGGRRAPMPSMAESPERNHSVKKQVYEILSRQPIHRGIEADKPRDTPTIATGNFPIAILCLLP